MKKIKITSKTACGIFLSAALLSILCVILSFLILDFEMTESLSLFYRDVIGCSVFSFTLFLGVHISELKKQ